MTDPLANLARRVEADPFFLAAALAEYARTEGLDDAGLVAALGLPPDQLPHLKLCRPPRPDHFWPDVEHLAGRFGIPPESLAEVVRRGEAVARARSASPPTGADAGAFLAARDADPPADGPP